MIYQCLLPAMKSLHFDHSIHQHHILALNRQYFWFLLVWEYILETEPKYKLIRTFLINWSLTTRSFSFVSQHCSKSFFPWTLIKLSKGLQVSSLIRCAIKSSNQSNIKWAWDHNNIGYRFTSWASFTEVTCPMIGWAQPELTLSKRQKMGPDQTA